MPSAHARPLIANFPRTVERRQNKTHIHPPAECDTSNPAVAAPQQRLEANQRTRGPWPSARSRFSAEPFRTCTHKVQFSKTRGIRQVIGLQYRRAGAHLFGLCIWSYVYVLTYTYI